jgi:hypothetical protein
VFGIRLFYGLVCRRKEYFVNFHEIKCNVAAVKINATYFIQRNYNYAEISFSNVLSTVEIDVYSNIKPKKNGANNGFLLNSKFFPLKSNNNNRTRILLVLICFVLSHY